MSKVHTIRRARTEEARHLSGLAFRSKAHWDYPQEFLESCRAELTVDADRLGSAGYQCFVAVRDDIPVGFYTVEDVSDRVFELEALFVEPDYIGTGIGRSLIQHAISLLERQGADRLVIQGDPNASDFYLAAGAHRIGVRESGSVPGRYLPLFEIELGSE